MLGPLLAAEPELAADVVFGIRASLLLADRHSELLLGRWGNDESTLRLPLSMTAGRMPSGSVGSAAEGTQRCPHQIR